MASQRFNLRNPAVKRILQELKELQASQSRDFAASVLEDNLFEWHFVVRGPLDTEFEGGIYHGRILLPPEYPFKPPSFMMLTQNGRFETGVKICLSISSHHPEHWQPSWSVRTALTALVAFMPTPGNGAIGSMDYSKEERKELARKSRLEPPCFGNAERQKVSQELHDVMLAAEQACKEAKELQGSTGAGCHAAAPAEASAAEPAKASAAESAAAPLLAEAQVAEAPVAGAQPAGSAPHQPYGTAVSEAVAAPAYAAGGGSNTAGMQARAGVPAPWAQQAAPAQGIMAQLGFSVTSCEDVALALLAGVLAAAIAALLLRRVLLVAGMDPTSPI